MVVKLIDRHKPTSASYANIDMFPLHFMGHTMDLPPVTSLKEYKKKASEKKKQKLKKSADVTKILPLS